MKTALITGASSGIGFEFAGILAQDGYNLVLVARGGKALEALKEDLEMKYSVKVEVLAKDLSIEKSVQEVFEFTQNNNIVIETLINNAGFGTYGDFVGSSWEKDNQMLNLNINALTHFTKLYGTLMANRRNGYILNVASTAAFQSGPGMAVYCATKAYVLSFTEAIAEELSDKGVIVSALCPGATASGFQAAAEMENAKLVKGKKLPTSKEVAEYGYRALKNKETVAIHGTMNYILANANRFAPRKLAVKITKMIMS